MKKNGYTLIELIICVIVVLIISVMIFLASLTIRGCNEISKNGVKNTLQQVWEGDSLK